MIPPSQYIARGRRQNGGFARSSSLQEAPAARILGVLTESGSVASVGSISNPLSREARSYERWNEHESRVTSGTSSSLQRGYVVGSDVALAAQLPTSSHLA
jgi:hypothetical protein